MNTFQAFKEFLAASSTEIPVIWFIINLMLSAVLALTLKHIYVKYGDSLSNRKLFGRNFVLMTMTTMLIISIVKSSLALSLGLVGALSIIRFRAAIKEPEELLYLFIAVSIGLGFGANQGVITVIAFIVIAAVLILIKKYSHDPDESQNLYLTVSSQSPEKTKLDKIVNTLKDHSMAINLKRLDETSEIMEAAFLVEFRGYEQLKEAKNALQELDKTLKFSFLDNKHIF